MEKLGEGRQEMRSGFRLVRKKKKIIKMKQIAEDESTRLENLLNMRTGEVMIQGFVKEWLDGCYH